MAARDPPGLSECASWMASSLPRMTGFAQLTFDSRSVAISQSTSAAQLLGKQLHEETILPRPVGKVLVAAQKPYLPETDLLVGADCLLVRRRRINRQAMVTALLDQEPGEGSDRVRPKALTVTRRVEEQVDPGMPKLHVSLLVG